MLDVSGEPLRALLPKHWAGLWISLVGRARPLAALERGKPLCCLHCTQPCTVQPDFHYLIPCSYYCLHLLMAPGAPGAQKSVVQTQTVLYCGSEISSTGQEWSRVSLRCHPLLYARSGKSLPMHWDLCKCLHPKFRKIPCKSCATC